VSEIFINGFKYYGALHLWGHFLNIFLQIPACREAGFAAMLLCFYPKRCKAPQYL